MGAFTDQDHRLSRAIVHISDYGILSTNYFSTTFPHPEVSKNNSAERQTFFYLDHLLSHNKDAEGPNVFPNGEMDLKITVPINGG